MIEISLLEGDTVIIERSGKKFLQFTKRADPIKVAIGGELTTNTLKNLASELNANGQTFPKVSTEPKEDFQLNSEEEEITELYIVRGIKEGKDLVWIMQLSKFSNFALDEKTKESIVLKYIAESNGKRILGVQDLRITKILIQNDIPFIIL